MILEFLEGRMFMFVVGYRKIWNLRILKFYAIKITHVAYTVYITDNKFELEKYTV